MPVIEGVGHSDYTPEKQVLFRGIIRMHLKICKGIFSRSTGSHTYQYIDMNAGRGDGSPSIFREEGSKLDIPVHALLIDDRAEQVARLRHLFAGQTAHITIAHGDHGTVVPPYCHSWTQSYFGLCYHDPNGEVSWETLANISAHPRCSKLDMLINMSATAQKRVRLAIGDRSKLYEYLDTIKKKHWLIRKPYGNWQWTFLIGTNWTEFPAWKKQHIYDLRSAQGQEILDKLALTARERFEAVQPRLEGF